MFEDYFRQYALLIIFAAAAVSVPVGMMMMSFMAQSIGVRPSRPSAVKESAYEGGMPPFGGRPARFNFRYYYYALLFVIFDVETIFLFPWAVSLDFTGWSGWTTMMIFIGELAIGLVYAWKVGALEWE